MDDKYSVPYVIVGVELIIRGHGGCRIIIRGNKGAAINGPHRRLAESCDENCLARWTNEKWSRLEWSCYL